MLPAQPAQPAHPCPRNRSACWRARTACVVHHHLVGNVAAALLDAGAAFAAGCASWAVLAGAIHQVGAGSAHCRRSAHGQHAELESSCCLPPFSSMSLDERLISAPSPACPACPSLLSQPLGLLARTHRMCCPPPLGRQCRSCTPRCWCCLRCWMRLPGRTGRRHPSSRCWQRTLQAQRTRPACRAGVKKAAGSAGCHPPAV